MFCLAWVNISLEQIMNPSYQQSFQDLAMSICKFFIPYTDKADKPCMNNNQDKQWTANYAVEKNVCVMLR